MNAIDLKRAEFRHYLEASGVMDALSNALIKLYDEVDKPSDPVAFVRQHFKRPYDENESMNIPKRIEDLDAFELHEKQQQELNMARQEIAKLREMLNSMTSNSPLNALSIDVNANGKSNEYQTIFSNPKYEGTLIKKHLTEDLFEKLLASQHEPSIIDCIVKVNTLESNPFGVIALNASCYSVFSDLFEAIIKEIHCVDECVKYPDSDWGDVSVFDKFDTESIVSMEISCCRSLTKIPFIAGTSQQDLESILTLVQNAIQSNHTDDNEIDGEFYKITDIKENEPIFIELEKTGLGFRSMNPQDHTLWPTGRALYVNCSRTQSILINEEEHLRFISKQMNGDFGLVYKNLIELVGKFSDGLDFERSDKFGWLTTNLKLLGTGICCKAYFKLKQSPDHIENVAEKSGIQITSIVASQTEMESIVELTNQKTFGLSEFECVKLFYEGIKEFIEALNECETQGEIADLSNQEVCDNSDEMIAKLNKTDETGETQQQTQVEDNTLNNKENSEAKNDAANQDNDENVQNVENTENTENDPNEQLPRENNKEIPLSDGNITDSLEPNNVNENNTDNLAEGEMDNEDILENNETNPNEANQNQMEAAEQPNGAEDHGEKGADHQTTDS